ncbi:hypothetical protein LIA77_04756 [Sarocladium implicatum]|nr:hypothetical protein LIA77_04756 [Sarocladium implicatum]
MEAIAHRKSCHSATYNVMVTKTWLPMTRIPDKPSSQSRVANCRTDTHTNRPYPDTSSSGSSSRSMPDVVPAASAEPWDLAGRLTTIYLISDLHRLPCTVMPLMSACGP